MNWRDVIELGQQSETVTSGMVTKSWTYATVFCNKKSVRQSETYEAASVGLKPELMFEIRSIDYAQQERVRFNSKVYEITRAYDKGEITELIVSAIVGSEV